MRYQKLGTIRKKKGLQLYEYSFNEGLLQDDITDVFVVKSQKKNLTSRRSRAADICVYCGQPIGFKTKTCASGGACTAASLT